MDPTNDMDHGTYDLNDFTDFDDTTHTYTFSISLSYFN